MLMEKLMKNKTEDDMQPKQHYRNDNEVRIAVVETTIGHINQTLIRIEKRFDSIDKRFEKIDEKLETMDKKIDDKLKTMDGKIDAINSRMWTIFLWILGVMSSFSLGLLWTIAKGFHWIGG